jgi:NAD(P)H-flavin reductase
MTNLMTADAVARDVVARDVVIRDVVATNVMTADPMQPLLYRIRQREKETEDTFTLEMEAANGAGIAGFGAGQFNMLYVFGIGEIPISISSNPASAHRIAHTTRAVGTVTRALNELRPGDMVGVRGPYGSCWPVEEAVGHDIVIVSGGIGLAPLRPALYHFLNQRERYGRIVLLYGARTPEDILYRRELEQWRSRLDLEVYVTVDRATGRWRGNVGLVTTLIRRAPFDPLNSVAFVCGPEVMMYFTLKELIRRGVRLQTINLSMERNMKCGIGLCGHCQFGPHFVCQTGPVFRAGSVEALSNLREV